MSKIENLHDSFCRQLATAPIYYGKHYTLPFRRYGVVSNICHAQRIPIQNRYCVQDERVNMVYHPQSSICASHGARRDSH